ncbi:DNA pilot protein [Dipodfec virus RodF1_24]|uniref:DNA pilot protein n=1 Tax=Dipodfec virus RodF1_24 TaxID=2929294 RepID=A0A976R8E8_9VIRU|nr:DNA pilot protein [Dipodfec virus RodF1_24]
MGRSSETKDRQSNETIAKWNINSQEKINQQNIDAQNNWNQQSMDFSREMYDKQVTDQYDSLIKSPSFEKQGWEQAGFNPYMQMAGKSAQTVSASAMSPAGAGAPQSVAPRVDYLPSRTFGQQSMMLQAAEVLQNVGKNFVDSQLSNEQAIGQQINNSTAYARSLAEINNLRQSGRLTKAQARDAEVQAEVSFDTRDAQKQLIRGSVASQEEATRLTTAQRALTEIQTEMASKELPWIDIEKQYQIANAMSDLDVKKMQIDTGYRAQKLKELAEPLSHMTSEQRTKYAEYTLDALYRQGVLDFGQMAASELDKILDSLGLGPKEKKTVVDLIKDDFEKNDVLSFDHFLNGFRRGPKRKLGTLPSGRKVLVDAITHG